MENVLRGTMQRLERLQALDKLGEMADQGDFDEFLGDKAACGARSAGDRDR